MSETSQLSSSKSIIACPQPPATSDTLCLQVVSRGAKRGYLRSEIFFRRDASTRFVVGLSRDELSLHEARRGGARMMRSILRLLFRVERVQNARISILNIEPQDRISEVSVNNSESTPVVLLENYLHKPSQAPATSFDSQFNAVVYSGDPTDDAIFVSYSLKTRVAWCLVLLAVLGAIFGVITSAVNRSLVIGLAVAVARFTAMTFILTIFIGVFH